MPQPFGIDRKIVLTALRWRIKTRYRLADISALRKHPINLWHWASRWQWFAVLLVGAVTMFGIGEYGIGIVLLWLSALSAASKIQHWNIVFRGAPALKAMSVFAILALSILSTATVISRKGNDRWSHLPEGWTWLDAHILGHLPETQEPPLESFHSFPLNHRRVDPLSPMPAPRGQRSAGNSSPKSVDQPNSQPTIVIQTVPVYGNLKQRTLKLCTEQQWELNMIQQASLRSDNPNPMIEFKSFQFRGGVLPEIRKLRDQFAAHDYHNIELDDFFATEDEYEQDQNKVRQLGGPYIKSPTLTLAEMERVLDELKDLADQLPN